MGQETYQPYPFSPNEKIPPSVGQISYRAAFGQYIQLIIKRDSLDPKIKNLHEQYEKEKDRLGKKSELYYLQGLRQTSALLGFEAAKAPFSLDYYKPKADILLQFEDGSTIAAQVFADLEHGNKKESASRILQKYWPTVAWGVRQLPGFPSKIFKPSPVGFVPIGLNSDRLDKINLWQPGQLIDNPQSCTAEFLNLLSRSLNPKYREQIIQLASVTPNSQIPSSQINEARRQLMGSWDLLENYSRQLRDLSKRIAGNG